MLGEGKYKERSHTWRHTRREDISKKKSHEEDIEVKVIYGGENNYIPKIISCIEQNPLLGYFF